MATIHLTGLASDTDNQTQRNSEITQHRNAKSKDTQNTPKLDAFTDHKPAPIKKTKTRQSIEPTYKVNLKYFVAKKAANTVKFLQLPSPTVVKIPFKIPVSSL